MRAMLDSSSLLGEPDALRAQFDADGYVFVCGVLDVEQVNLFATEVKGILRALGLLEVGEDALDRFRRTRTEFYAAVQRLELFHAIAHDPSLVGIVRALVGEDAFAHPQKLLRAILPGIEELVTPPHQDYAYIRGAERTVTAWLPLRTCRVADGALRVLVGSHRRGPLPLRPSSTVSGSRVEVDEDDGDWATADLEPGDVLMFHSMTVHGAMPNTSPRIRLSADFRFQSASEPIAARSLKPSGYPQVPDWPELLADVGWNPERWLAVEDSVTVVEFSSGRPLE
jgi:hypothetical protein